MSFYSLFVFTDVISVFTNLLLNRDSSALIHEVTRPDSPILEEEKINRRETMDPRRPFVLQSSQVNHESINQLPKISRRKYSITARVDGDDSMVRNMQVGENEPLKVLHNKIRAWFSMDASDELDICMKYGGQLIDPEKTPNDYGINGDDFVIDITLDGDANADPEGSSGFKGKGYRVIVRIDGDDKRQRTFRIGEKQKFRELLKPIKLQLLEMEESDELKVSMKFDGAFIDLDSTPMVSTITFCIEVLIEFSLLLLSHAV